MVTESTQIAQMVAWLDDERRKDKALITRLEERFNSQATLITEQTRRIAQLETEIAGLRGSILNPLTFEESMTRLRTELTTALEQAEARRTLAIQDVRKTRDMDREASNKAIEDFRGEVITRLEREMQPRRVEEERLSRVALELQTYADSLNRGLEEFSRTLTYLEEQRRGDSRRIADLGGEILEIAKRNESQQTKVELLEELARRNERGLAELSGNLIEMRQQRQTWVEQEALTAQKRETLMNDMVQRMDAFNGEMQMYSKQALLWSDTHRAIQKELEDFNRVADRVDRRLNEVTELQRLSEERFRVEWEEFQQEDQKRWRQFTLTNEESWRENERAIADLRAQISMMTERIGLIVAQVKSIQLLQNDHLKAVSDYIQALRERSEDETKHLSALV
ncbi:MAG: hypothetical protein IT326_09400 [Anaerolineae bacterium]|nr:hypothetical protein [Anaerolineae bacterium]